MAYQYWQLARAARRSRRFVALAEAYHGDTVGSVSVGGIDLFHETLPRAALRRRAAPHALRATARRGGRRRRRTASQRAEALFAREGPTSSRRSSSSRSCRAPRGCWCSRAGYLARLAALCREYDVLLICDEVATGFGRTGTMFAVEQEHVRPTCCASRRGSPAATCRSRRRSPPRRSTRAFLGAVAEKKTFFHGHTYTGNPLACAAALANLALFETERTLEKMKAAAGRARPATSTRIAELAARRRGPPRA